jgi:pimeloyl-ACP methyl ester carboxylesterase
LAHCAAVTQGTFKQPHWTADDLAGIKVPTWIVDADHDEAIKRDNTLFMADHIRSSGLLIEPQVSHFAFLQDPQQFNTDVLHFLMHLKSQ